MGHTYISEIPNDMFTDLVQIGSGAFSDIFSATYVKTNTKVALKITIKSSNKEKIEMLEQEININKILFHPFICKFYHDLETEHLKIIAMEIIDGISALDYVNQRSGLPINEVRNLFVQLLIAIEYLHNEARITHRDLKLENIMIDECDHIRLIDFGFSTTKSLMTTFCGSIPYCSPEVLTGQLYSRSSDIWSMGVILYGLYVGELPFYNTNIDTMVSMICKSNVNYPDDFDPDLKDLIDRMLQKDPDDRITIEEIKNHPFVSQDKLIQINYKQLFSNSNLTLNAKIISPSIQKPNNRLCKKMSSTVIKRHVSSDLLLKPHNDNNTLFLSSMSILSPLNSHHKKISSYVDEVDLLIKSRQNFSYNLNQLIETAISQNDSKIKNEQLIVHDSQNSDLNNNLRQTACFQNKHPLPNNKVHYRARETEVEGEGKVEEKGEGKSKKMPD